MVGFQAWVGRSSPRAATLVLTQGPVWIQRHTLPLVSHCSAVGREASAALGREGAAHPRGPITPGRIWKISSVVQPEMSKISQELGLSEDRGAQHRVVP